MSIHNTDLGYGFAEDQVVEYSPAENKSYHATSMLRDTVKEEVDAILWLDQLKKDDQEYQKKLDHIKSSGSGERCLVCTLPNGTCEHTRVWIKEKDKEREESEFREKTDLDKQINDILNVMGDEEFQIETKPVEEDIDITNMQWNVLEQRLTDKIGHTDVCLFSPDERGWQSMVKLTPRKLLVFGGFKYKKDQVPEPFKAVPLANEVEYLNDIRLYDCDNLAWHGVKATGEMPSKPSTFDMSPRCESSKDTTAAAAAAAAAYLLHSASTGHSDTTADYGGGSPKRKATGPVLPEGRYGHVAAALDAHRMLVFGGRAEKGRVLNDTWIFHLHLDAWELVQNNEALNLPTPPPRYFSSCCSIVPEAVPMECSASHSYSVSAAINRDELTIGTGFRAPGYTAGLETDPSLHDEDCSDFYKNGADRQPGPSADVYLFGGTDGIDNFGDLWVFRGHPSVLRWERLVAVGLPPCPRYGHQLVLLTGKGDFKNTTMEGASIAGSGQQLMVLGGCSVSPQGEVVGSNLGVAETQALMALSSQLRHNYRAEEKFVRDAGNALESSVLLELERLGLDGLYKQAADTSGALHELELQSRVAELQMVDRFKLSAGNTKFNIKQARHPTPLLDVHILNVTEMMWRNQIYPPIRGDIPSCRIHFGAACIGNHVFVLGGAEPTSLRYRHVEAENTLIYVLHLKTMRWEQPTAVNSAEHLREALIIADADVIRAYRRCDEEKARGLSLGALNGKTIELCEAQAVLEVCKWRRSVLEKEEHDQTKAPPGRWGASMVSQGQRLVYMGGWENASAIIGTVRSIDEVTAATGGVGAGAMVELSATLRRGGPEGVGVSGRAVRQGRTMVCNVEHDHERRRRLHDEFQARLERDRIAEQAQANMANVQSVFELRAKLRKEAEDAERERGQMALEDLLSSLPPLYKPSAVQFVKANQHTIWVKWERLYKNTNREIIDPDAVTYFLYARSSFENLQVGDRVYVTAPMRDEELRRAGSRPGGLIQQGSNDGGLNVVAEYDGDLVFFDESCKRFPGEILKFAAEGTFDVLFDDGAVEKKVPRRRISLAPAVRYSQIPLERLRTSKTRGSAAGGSAPGTPTGSVAGPGKSDGADGDSSLKGSAPPQSAASSVSGSVGSSVAAMLHASAPLSVVPLELSVLVRNRMKQRIMRAARAADKLDLFRGVTAEMKKQKQKELRRQEKRRKAKSKKLKKHHRRKHKPRGNDLESARRRRSKDLRKKEGGKSSSRRKGGGAGGSVASSAAMSTGAESSYGGGDFTLSAVIAAQATKPQSSDAAGAGRGGGGLLERQLNTLRKGAGSPGHSTAGSVSSASYSTESGDSSKSGYSRGTLSRSGSFMSTGSGYSSFADDDNDDLDDERAQGKQQLRPALSRGGSQRSRSKGGARRDRGVSFDVDDESIMTADTGDGTTPQSKQQKQQGAWRRPTNPEHDDDDDRQRLYGEAVFTFSGDDADFPQLGCGDQEPEPPQTVRIDPRWQLVYVGNDTEYSCTGLVADDAVQREPLLSVPVAFCVQAHGVDHPHYERSQLSNTVFFYTQPSAEALEAEAFAAAEAAVEAAAASSRAKRPLTSSSTPAGSSAAAAPGPDRHQSGSSNNNNNNGAALGPGSPSGATGTGKGQKSSGAGVGVGGPKPGMSKTKKEIISAVLSGKKMIEIERLDNTCIGYGVGDEFL